MQATNKMVSVIVLSYNHSRFLVECLDSLSAQTYTDWELIIADDASKDDSVAVIQNWLQASGVKAKCNFHTQNTGVCTVLNECLDLCAGAYIKAIAADDVMHPGLLQEAVTAFEQGDPALGVVYTNAEYINEHSAKQGRTIIPAGSVAPSGWIRNELVQRNFIPAPGVVLKKEVYDKIGKYDTEIVTDDYDCWLRASAFFSFLYIDKALVYYRMHTHNISNTIDFSADEIKILIRNDADGSLKTHIEKRIRDRYFLNRVDSGIIESYSRYTHHNKWLLFSLKKGLPYKVFRLADKVFNTTS